MIYTKDQTEYILKHESGKYFLMPDHVPSLSDYLTDEPLQATRFSTRDLAEYAIKRNKEMDRREMRWHSEMELADVIAACTVKSLKVHTEFEVEE